MTRALLTAGVAAIVCASAGTASAQAGSVPPGRVEIGVGVLYAGGVDYGSTPGIETTPGNTPLTLFSTTSDLGRSVGADGRVGIRITRAMQIEADASYARATLQSTVGGDFENAAAVTATESVERVTVGGSLVLRLARWGIGARGEPFVIAGAGYIRQLHENRTLIDTGATFQIGGGVNFALVTRDAGMKALGIRVDGRALGRSRGVALDGRAHVSPAAGASLFVRF